MASLDAACAEAIAEIFSEVIIAPEFTAEALEILQRKKNLRLLKVLKPIAQSSLSDIRGVGADSFLVQDPFGNSSQFVWFQNYAELFRSSNYLDSFRITAVFSLWVAVSGIAFAGTQFVVSNVLGPELADLLAALIAVVAVIGLLAVWRPSTEWHFENEPPAEERESYDTPPLGRTLYSWSPFVIIIALFLLAQVPPIKAAISSIQIAINFPTAAVSETSFDHAFAARLRDA